jgi:tRNA(Ser,Leu) C12 N-acetylase TAN1
MNRHPHFEAPPEPEEELAALDAGHFFADDFGTTAAEQAAHEPLAARLARERPDAEEAESVEVRPVRPRRIDEPGHWNVIATTVPRHEAEARALLSNLGEVRESPFPNVVLLTVGDVDAFADALLQVIADDPFAGRSLGRVLPAQHTCRFGSLADLEAITDRLIDDWAQDLEGMTFHVRCHRRGRVNDLDPVEEEGFLGDAILDTLADRHARGRVSFDDPDVVIDIETVNDEAAISMWTRDDLRTYRFLRVE